MKNYWYKNLLLLVAISSFAGVSKVIFDKVHLTSKNVIDEEFHLPQGLQYCNYNFSTVNFLRIPAKELILIFDVLVGSQNNDIAWLVLNFYCYFWACAFLHSLQSKINQLNRMCSQLPVVLCIHRFAGSKGLSTNTYFAKICLKQDSFLF